MKYLSFQTFPFTTFKYFYPMDIHSLMQEINAKAQKLKSRTERLEKENEELRNSVFNYLKELEAQKIELNNLKTIAKNQSKNSTLSQKDLEKYILLVDKCIASIDVNLDK